MYTRLFGAGLTMIVCYGSGLYGAGESIGLVFTGLGVIGLGVLIAALQSNQITHVVFTGAIECGELQMLLQPFDSTVPILLSTPTGVEPLTGFFTAHYDGRRVIILEKGTERV